MPLEKQKNLEKIEPREITEELQESYLDYAMSVIVSRALPDVRDGLKPVQRRILWAMWDMGLGAGAKFMKSARVTGETMGKYHPHGDMAVYDALVRMAQDFSLRYPLIKGQGNFGSVDGDSAAAQRYTECRLSKIAEELLLDIEKETVNWTPNYDGSRLEPKCLPAKLPNLLINGAVGIAVGMATSIPPHNLGEVINALIYLVDNPKAETEDLMKFIPGPDFPTGGIIYDKTSLNEAYKTGHGSITMRAVAEIQERKSGSFQIIVSEIPYQVNKSDLVTNVAQLVQEKKIEGIRDLRDESDREGLRIVVELKNDAVPQKILNQLFKYTELQKNFYFNLLALNEGIQPKVFSLKELLAAYLNHRQKVIRRRTEFDLKKTEERAHILTGLVKALSVIDKIISTIKKSKDKEAAHAALMKNFHLSFLQAEAILEMKLQTLAALEGQKLEDELKEKKKLINELQLILKEPKIILKIIKEELSELAKNFPSPRRTKMVASGLKEFKEEDLISQEETIVTLSQTGYIKRMPPAAFHSQKRGGKGTIGFELKEEDFIGHFISAQTHDDILFFTDRGKVFQTKVYEIPAASRTAKGKAVQNFLEITPAEKISALVTYAKLAGKEHETIQKGLPESIYVVMVTKNGLIKKTTLSDFENIRHTGIIALNLNKDDFLKNVSLSSGSNEVIITTAHGQAIRFKEKEIRTMGRTASGVRAIRLKKDDFVSGFDIIRKTRIKTDYMQNYAEKSPRQSASSPRGSALLVVMANGFAKQTPLNQYKVQKRGGSGIKTAKITAKTGLIIASHIVDEKDEEILAFSSKGQVLKTKLGEVRTAGRATSGVRIMKLKQGDKIAGIMIL